MVYGIGINVVYKTVCMVCRVCGSVILYLLTYVRHVGMYLGIYGVNTTISECYKQPYISLHENMKKLKHHLEK